MPENNSELRRNQIKFLFQKGIEAALPKNLFKRFITLQDDVLTINSINTSEKFFNLSSYRNIFVTGAGKASCSMAEALEDILIDQINSGIVVTKYGFVQTLKKIKILEAGHPVPDENSINAAKEILDLINSAGENDLIINLISGGASALLTLPIDEISLEDKIQTTKILLSNEASIDEINTIRKCISKVKGGGLIAGTKAEIISLIISDVIGDDLGTIASGPTVVVQKDYLRALEIIRKYNLEKSVPQNVIAYLNEKKNSQNSFSEYEIPKHENFLIGNNDIVVDEIINLAEHLGYSTLKINEKILGEVNNAAKEYFSLITNLQEIKKPLCIVSGGETTVNIKGNGLGGRNQQFCLALAEYIDERNIVILSGGTDGNDGPTDAAGAIIDNDILVSAKKQNLDFKFYLENNDSYNFFEKTNALVKTGPTLTNVMDIQIAILY